MLIKKIALTIGLIMLPLIAYQFLAYREEKSILKNYVLSGPFANKLDEAIYGRSDCYFDDQPKTVYCKFIALNVSKEECEVGLSRSDCNRDTIEKVFGNDVVVETVSPTTNPDIFEYRVLLKPKL